MLANTWNESFGKIHYIIFAQVVPADPAKFTDKARTISPFRTVKQIQVHRLQPDPIPNVSGLTSQIKTKIGGLMGLGGDECTTDITFERNQYYGGD